MENLTKKNQGKIDAVKLQEQLSQISVKLEKLQIEVKKLNENQEILLQYFKSIFNSITTETLRYGKVQSDKRNFQLKNLNQPEADGGQWLKIRNMMVNEISSLLKSQINQLLISNRSLANQMSCLLNEQGKINNSSEMMEELMRLLVANTYLDDVSISMGIKSNIHPTSCQGQYGAPTSPNYTIPPKDFIYSLYFSSNYAPSLNTIENKDQVVLSVIELLIHPSPTVVNQLKRLVHQNLFCTYEAAIRSFPTMQEAEDVKSALSDYGIFVVIQKEEK